jgi:hypothetical protein
MILSLQERFGCTHEYILWRESWTNLQMKIADSVRSVPKEPKPIETEEELRDFLDIHE